MRIQIIQVPYDSGHKSVRMGRGPEHFIGHGACESLRDRGCEVYVDRIEAMGTFMTEVGTTFELNRLLAERVRTAVNSGSFPLVLAGNCNSSIGTLAGLDAADLGIIWFDGHGDFNTPETTVSGFLDGMGLAMATGRCWKPLLATVPGFTPVAEKDVVLVGARDFDTEEKKFLEQSDIAVVAAESIRENGIQEALQPALVALQSRLRGVYLHIDLDVLDPGEAQANHLAPPNGLTVKQVEEAVRMVGNGLKICGAAITAYDPEYDPEGRTSRAGVKLMEMLVSEHHDQRVNMPWC